MPPSNKLLAEWFWTDRWTGSSAFMLPIAARGLYREMLTQAWRRGAKLPNDLESVRRVTGVTELEFASTWPLVSKFWRVDADNNLVNDTQIEVYRQAVSLQHVRREAGRLGGLTTQAKRQATVQATPEAKLNPPISVSVSVSGSPSPNSVTGSQSSNNKQRDSENQPARVKPLSLNPQPKPNGNGNGLKNPNRDPFVDEAVTERAGPFIERYQQLYQQHRNGARYAVKPARDYQAAVTLCQTWTDDARLEKLAVCFLTTDHKFADEGSRTLPQFLALASWCDGKLAEWESKRA